MSAFPTLPSAGAVVQANVGFVQEEVAVEQTLPVIVKFGKQKYLPVLPNFK